MKVSRIVRALEAIAPPDLAAEWDNVGLLVGQGEANASKVLLCVDLTEETLSEAISAKAALVVAYHPVIVAPLARLTTSSAPVPYAAARHGLSVYCTHTALDAAPGGTNDVLGDAMGLIERRPLEPAVRTDECKVVVFTPLPDLSRVAGAAFDAGAGRIGNYSECAFFCHGIGSFYSGAGTHPASGRPGRHEANEEMRLEVICPKQKVAAVCGAMRQAHTYEEPAIDVYPVQQYPPGYGMGRLGRLKRPATVRALIARVKRATKLKHVLLAAGPRPAARRGGAKRKAGDGQGALVRTAACCAGACGAAFRAAVAGGASFLLTGQMRHDEALEATAAGLTIACLGDSNSGRMALSNLAERLRQVLPRVTVLLAKSDHDPFQVA